MFGYVRARRADLLVRQDALYRGIYCGLCREMGRCTGQCSRLTLSYDMVFLYLIRASLQNLTPRVRQGRCALHPFRRRPMVESDAELRYAARVSALLVYGKVCDDLADERGVKRLLKRFARPFAAHAKKRADLDALYREIEARQTELAELEAEKLPSVDAPADCFGRLLSAVFAYGLEGDAKMVASAVGFRTGRWIYAVDAADDLNDDAKNGAYNPFIRLYGDSVDEKQRELIASAMRIDLNEISNALLLADESELIAIARNIAECGMADATDKAVLHSETTTGGQREQKPV